ncbi:MAG: transposase [Candidatus Thorarchaeota archaeon]
MSDIIFDNLLELAKKRVNFIKMPQRFFIYKEIWKNDLINVDLKNLDEVIKFMEERKDIQWVVGLDVHKDWIWAAFQGQKIDKLDEDYLGPVVKFKNDNFGRDVLKKWIQAFKAERVLMENTGHFNLIIRNKIAEIYDPNTVKLHVYVMNSLDTARFQTIHIKTDERDARNLAKLATQPMNLSNSRWEDLEEVHYRYKCRRIGKLVQQVVRFENQIHGILHMNGINTSFSFNETSKIWLKLLCKNEGKLGDLIVKVYNDPKGDKNLIKLAGKFIPFMESTLSEKARDSICMILFQLERQEMVIKLNEKELLEWILYNEYYKKQYEHIRRVPGFGEGSLVRFILETGNPERFKRVSSFMCYAGVAPQISESAKAKKKDRPNWKSNRHLKIINKFVGQGIYNSAKSKIESGKNILNDLLKYAEKLYKKGGIPRGKKIWKIGAKALRVAFTCLRNKVPYDEFFETKQAIKMQEKGFKKIKVKAKRKRRLVKEERALIKGTFVKDGEILLKDMADGSKKFEYFKKHLEKLDECYPNGYNLLLSVQPIGYSENKVVEYPREV